jgi:hypothetical protein
MCRCSEKQLTSCANGSFLECSPPTVEARGSIPRPGHVSPGNSGFRMEMILVKSLHASMLDVMSKTSFLYILLLCTSLNNVRALLRFMLILSSCLQHTLKGLSHEMDLALDDMYV